MRICLALAIALLLGACGSDGPDIGGVYAVTSIVEDPTGCGAGTTPTDPPAFLYAKSDDFFGHTIWNVKACTGQDPMTCGNEIVSFLSQSIDHGYAAPITVSSGSGMSCSYTYEYETAVVVNDVLTVETTTYSQVDMNTTQDKCTTAEAKKRGTSMPCSHHELATGTLVK